ncbi:cobyrinic acid a,c-diamide synthase [Pseudomonas agarici]|uniref:Cobyrinic acid a,c-diamide synthase n=1 Tax=Pseudomonas agarici TaxID=46677 RepID=A0A0X1T211_PSEAA|nr:hypothetical protein [Pseudomonas agarici]AMB86051.1 cobyrinic acid a,c-diamide synthase [Pseudomonas agarici]
MTPPIISPLHASKNLQRLVAFAIAHGWSVTRTPGGHIKFTKIGRGSIFTSSTASDYRSGPKATARLRRADRTSSQHSQETI